MIMMIIIIIIIIIESDFNMDNKRKQYKVLCGKFRDTLFVH